MILLRRIAAGILIVIALAAIGANVWAPARFDAQFRDFPDAAPSRQFLLGTDELGRDRFSRLLYAAQVSLLLAPAAALVSVGIAAGIGLAAGLLGGFTDRVMTSVVDLFLCVPVFFLLLIVRSMLPLNTDPWTSVTITFLLLAVAGWAACARVLRAGVQTLARSDFALQAHAAGISRSRFALVHLLPQLRPLMISQFWLAIPGFLLAEANLGMLGLGVSEPMPSLGNSLAQLTNLYSVAAAPWRLAPLILLLLVLACLHLVLHRNHQPIPSISAPSKGRRIPS